MSGRRLAGALVVAAAAAPLGGASAQIVFEDQTKHVALVAPEGFVYDAASSSELFVLLGPKLAGGQARLELHSVDGDLPVDAALEQFMAPLFGEAQPTPWDVGEAAARLPAAWVAEHTSDRKLLTTAVAAGRNGPAIVVLVAEAPPALFEQLAADWRTALDSLQFTPRQPVYSDEALGLAVHAMPDWMKLDREGTEAGRKAAWVWLSDDKTFTATIVIEASPRVADFGAWAAERDQAHGRTGGLSKIDRSERPLGGRPGVQFELTYGGGTTRRIRAVQSETHLIQITCTAPTSMLADTFDDVFEGVVGSVTVDGGTSGG